MNPKFTSPFFFLISTTKFSSEACDFRPSTWITLIQIKLLHNDLSRGGVSLNQ